MYSSFDHTPVTVVQNLVNLLCHLNILNVTFRHKTSCIVNRRYRSEQYERKIFRRQSHSTTQAHLLSWQPCPLWEPSHSHPIWWYDCRLGDLMCFVFMSAYCMFDLSVYCLFLQYFDTVSIYCVGGDVKHCSIQSNLGANLAFMLTHGKLLRFEINFLVVIVVVVYWNIVAVLLHLFSD